MLPATATATATYFSFLIVHFSLLLLHWAQADASEGS